MSDLSGFVHAACVDNGEAEVYAYDMDAHVIGPYSRPNAIAKLDQRTKEAALLRRVRRDLVAHVGGKPSKVQLALIERAARLTLHVELMDKRAFAAGELSEKDSREYLAWSNSLTRTLRELGLKAASVGDKTPSLDAIAARHVSPKAAAP